MKRGTVVGLVVAGALVLGVSGAVAVVSLGGGAPQTSSTLAPYAAPSETPPTPDAERDEPEADATQDTGDDETTTPGAYVDYSEDALASAQGQRILFFHAPWCPQCRSLESDIESQGVPDGITVVKVDYDSNQSLRQKYGVTVQTTVIALDEAGEATARFVPYDTPTLGAALIGLNLR